jgi:hypothetical protein
LFILDHHLAQLLVLQFIVHKRKRKLLIEVAHDLGKNSINSSFSITSSFAVHQHLKDENIKKTNGIAVIHLIVEKKIKNDDHTLHHLKKSKLIPTQQFGDATTSPPGALLASPKFGICNTT